MALSEDYVRYLEDFFTLTENNPKLTAWERKFVDDQKQRFEEHGAEMWLSDKQKAILMRIEEKLA